MKKYRAYDYMELVANAIDKVLKKKCIIIFFGSILTDRFGRTSDIDVAVYCGKAIGIISKYWKKLRDCQS